MLTTDERRRPWRCDDGLRPIALDRGDEPIAASLYRLDETRLSGVVPQYPPHVEDFALHCLRLDRHARPHRVEQFVVCHQPASALDEILQYGELRGSQ